MPALAMAGRGAPGHRGHVSSPPPRHTQRALPARRVQARCPSRVLRLLRLGALAAAVGGAAPGRPCTTPEAWSATASATSARRRPAVAGPAADRRRPCFSPPSVPHPQPRLASPTAQSRPQPRRLGCSRAPPRSIGWAGARRNRACTAARRAVRVVSRGGAPTGTQHPRPLPCSPRARAPVRLVASVRGFREGPPCLPAAALSGLAEPVRRRLGLHQEHERIGPPGGVEGGSGTTPGLAGGRSSRCAPTGSDRGRRRGARPPPGAPPLVPAACPRRGRPRPPGRGGHPRCPLRAHARRPTMGAGRGPIQGKAGRQVLPQRLRHAPARVRGEARGAIAVRPCLAVRGNSRRAVVGLGPLARLPGGVPVCRWGQTGPPQRQAGSASAWASRRRRIRSLQTPGGLWSLAPLPPVSSKRVIEPLGPCAPRAFPRVTPPTAPARPRASSVAVPVVRPPNLPCSAHGAAGRGGSRPWLRGALSPCGRSHPARGGRRVS